jgi:hypothetical protein
MKAQVILVFYVPGATDKGEAEDGATALFTRLADQAKAADLRLIKVAPGTVSHDGLAEPVTRVAVPKHSEPGTGVYIIAHHGIGPFAPVGLGGILESTFAAIIAGYVETQKLPPLAKVALLACHGASRDDSELFGNPMAADSSLVLLCRELAGKGQTPRIAGWDSFVSVCFPANPEAHGKAAKPANAGRKFSHRKDRPTNANDRDGYKKIMRWDADQKVVQEVALAGWTQKEPGKK